MTKRNIDDEMLIMDFVTGNCDEGQHEAVQERIDQDESFRKHYEDIASFSRAVKQSIEVEPPQGLARATMELVRQKRQTDALLAREEAARGPRPSVLSLRELAAAVAVVVMLLLVMIPSFRQANHLAQRDLCGAQVGLIGAGLNSYANSNDDYFPAATGAPDRRWMGSISNPPPSNAQSLFKLIAGGYAGTGSFRCPALEGDQKDTADFMVVAGMLDFPRGDYVDYSYQHSISSAPLRRSDRALTNVASSMAVLADSNPVFVKGRFDPTRVNQSASDNHAQEGQNVLYLDMHVDWSKTACAGVAGNNIYLAEGVFHYEGDEQPTGPTDTFLLPAFTPPNRPAINCTNPPLKLSHRILSALAPRAIRMPISLVRRRTANASTP